MSPDPESMRMLREGQDLTEQIIAQSDRGRRGRKRGGRVPGGRRSKVESGVGIFPGIRAAGRDLPCPGQTQDAGEIDFENGGNFPRGKRGVSEEPADGLISPSLNFLLVSNLEPLLEPFLPEEIEDRDPFPFRRGTRALRGLSLMCGVGARSAFSSHGRSFFGRS